MTRWEDGRRPRLAAFAIPVRNHIFHDGESLRTSSDSRKPGPRVVKINNRIAPLDGEGHGYTVYGSATSFLLKTTWCRRVPWSADLAK